MKIVETDNFGRDYPMEKFLNLPQMTEEHAKEVVKAINKGFPIMSSRYWKVVPNDYVLDNTDINGDKPSDCRN